MAFIVEDGTGLVDANAYASIADVDSYHSDRGNSAWVATDLQKEQCIVKATDYVDLRFGSMFSGLRFNPGVQALYFPRAGLTDSDGIAVTGIPHKLKFAIAEYSIRVLEAINLLPDPTLDDSGLLISSLDEQVGPIQEKKNFNARIGIISLRPYPGADRWLLEFLGAGGGAIRG